MENLVIPRELEVTDCLSIPEYFWRRKYREGIKLIRRHLNAIFPEKQPPYRIIDLGSGRGQDLLLLYDNLPESIRSQTAFTGVEGFSDFLEDARGKVQGRGIRSMEFIQHDIAAALPFETHSVDFAYCSEVIEHMASPEALIREVKRVLKKGGFFYLTTMNQPNFLELQYWRNLLGRRNSAPSTAVAPDIKHTAVVQGKKVPIYGHISVRTLAEWDACLKREGFRLTDFARGALRYALPEKLNALRFIKPVLFSAEKFFDLFPRNWTRNFSSQMIALYQSES